MGGGDRERTRRGDGIIQGASPSDSPQQHGRLRDSGVNAALRNLTALLPAVGNDRGRLPGPLNLWSFFFFLQLQADARRDCDFKNLEKHLDPSSRGVVEQVCVRAWCHPPLRQCCGRYNRASVQRWLLCGWQLADVRGYAQCILPLRIRTKILLAVSRTFPSRPAPRSARNAAPHTPLRRNLAGRLHREHGSTPTGVGHTRIVFDVAVCRPDPRPRPLQHLVGRSRGRRYTDTSVHHMPRLA